jgi:hypothetical protein
VSVQSNVIGGRYQKKIPRALLLTRTFYLSFLRLFGEWSSLEVSTHRLAVLFRV